MLKNTMRLARDQIEVMDEIMVAVLRAKPPV